VNALQQKYGIGGSATIQQWIKKYGRSGYRSEKVVIQTVEDQAEFQAMKARIRELEAALAESVLEARMLEAIVETASEHYGEDLKKNFARRV
jgi:transposase-like protein